MEVDLEKVVEVLALGFTLHACILSIAKHSDTWLRLVDKKHRGWMIVLFVLTILLLAAIHLLR